MFTRWIRRAAWVVLASAVFGTAPKGAHAVADPLRVGFPSSDPVDGRFLSKPSAGISSLNVPTHLSIGVPASEALNPLIVEIFDGDIGGKWDKPGGSTVTYALYADATRDGTNLVPLASATDVAFADDLWVALYNGSQSPAAQAPSLNYFYRLIVTSAGGAGALDGYKVSIRKPGQISAIQNEFGIVGGVVQAAVVDALLPYDLVVTTTDPVPSLDPAALNPSNTYDGTFNFKIYVGQSGASVSLQEGDADHMTDATAAVAAEAGLLPAPGHAPDGSPTNVIDGLLVDYRSFVVGGPVWYRVKAPNGATLATATDPSGDAEYETVPQFDTTQIGFYTMEWHDLDLRNTLFVKPAFGTEVFSPESAPVGAPLATGLGNVRGVLFYDKNGDGIQQAAERGLAGVPVDVTNLDTSVVTTVVTNAYGQYGAGVPAGPYKASPGTGTPADLVLGTTVAGPTPVVTPTTGQTLDAALEGYVDSTGADPSLALVPECRGTLTAFGLDVELPADLTGLFIQV